MRTELEYDELSYRRGYLHGYCQAMDDMLKASLHTQPAWEKVCKFLDGPLVNWRYCTKPEIEPEMPPSYSDFTK